MSRDRASSTVLLDWLSFPLCVLVSLARPPERVWLARLCVCCVREAERERDAARSSPESVSALWCVGESGVSAAMFTVSLTRNLRVPLWRI